VLRLMASSSRKTLPNKEAGDRMSIFPTKILLATDGSKDAELAAKAAVDLSTRTGAQLHVVHAWRPLPHYAYPSLTPEEYHPPFEEGARKLLDEQLEHIDEAGGVVAGSHLVAGRPADAILDLAEKVEVDLIVVGSRGLGPLRRLVVGSVSGEIVHHADLPVLVVRGGEGAWPLKRVVVGDDGSEPAKRAGELAVGIAEAFGAEAALVRAYQSSPEPIGGWTAEDRRELDQTLSRERQALDERGKELGMIAGSPPAVKLIDTEPTLAMLLVAEEGEEEKTLIAVGSRGVGVAKRAMLGSVSSKILRVAVGPVLVCPRGRPTEV
jgi:nucleotide-binding universal stress UspA family protein